MRDAFNIVISGVGGQGILKLSKIIGESALFEGKNVVMSEVHGMAQRGGVVISEMRIGDVNSPLVEEGDADLIIALEPSEAFRVINKAGSKTWFVINTEKVVPFTVSLGISSYPDVDELIENIKKVSKNVVVFNGVELSKKAGSLISLNMVMLGAVSTLPNFPLKEDTLVKVMEESFKGDALKVNKLAFNFGKEEAKQRGG